MHAPSVRKILAKKNQTIKIIFIKQMIIRRYAAGTRNFPFELQQCNIISS